MPCSHNVVRAGTDRPSKLPCTVSGVIRIARTSKRAIWTSLRVSIALLSFAVTGFVTSSAIAQTTTYTSVEITSENPIRLSYHASAHKNCTPAPAPTINVAERPKAGALLIRKGMLATDKVAGCGRISVPVQVVFYNPKEGYVGPDHVIYEVADSNGQMTTYDFTITVKTGPPAPKAKPGTKI
jgi:hypothetical protein